jgi:hypothetical protein
MAKIEVSSLQGWIPLNINPIRVLTTSGRKPPLLPNTQIGILDSYIMSTGINVPDYLRRVSERLARESREIGNDYQHPGAIGRSREDRVRVFLDRHRPTAFKISRGFIVSADNVASSETDLLIRDRRPLRSQGSGCHVQISSSYRLPCNCVQIGWEAFGVRRVLGSDRHRAGHLLMDPRPLPCV